MEGTMKPTIKPSVWQVSVLGGEVFGGRCDYCKETFSADAMSQNLYRAHRRHMATMFVWARILTPNEYRGLELRLPVEWFVGRDRRLLEPTLHLPCIVFKLFCNFCQIERFPVTGSEVLTFRSEHSAHIEAVQINAVLQNFVGRAVQENICVIGEQDSGSLKSVAATISSAFALERATQLREISKSFHCTLTSMRCTACKSRQLLNHQAQLADELSLHLCHWKSVHFHVKIKRPEEHAGREMEIPALPFSVSSLASPEGLSIQCVLVKLFRQHGGPSITPWNEAEVESYIRDPEGRRNQPRFLALVRSQRGRAFQCEFPVIHVHSPSRFFPEVSWPKESVVQSK
jgi:hypothetical protein